MAALASAARQEILDALAQLGSVSIAELAAAVGRPADSLYHHLRILQRAGLVEASGFRETDRGREALVQAAGRDLRIDYDRSRRRNTGELAAVISSMMRLGIRDSATPLATRRSSCPATTVNSGLRGKRAGCRKKSYPSGITREIRIVCRPATGCPG
jgi:DNA-binding transcriptional ArsR family regulator